MSRTLDTHRSPALAILEKILLGPDHPKVADILNHLAGLYFARRPYHSRDAIAPILGDSGKNAWIQP